MEGEQNHQIIQGLLDEGVVGMGPDGQIRSQQSIAGSQRESVQDENDF